MSDRSCKCPNCGNIYFKKQEYYTVDVIDISKSHSVDLRMIDYVCLSCNESYDRLDLLVNYERTQGK